MGLFNRKNKKVEENKIEEPVKKAEIIEENINIELAFNEEEAEIIKYFNLSDNFTIEEVLYKNNDIPNLYKDEQVKKEIEEKERKLKLYLYKKQEFTNAIKKYYSTFNSKTESYTCIFDNYGVIEKRKDNSIYEKEIYLANNHIIFEAKKLEKNISNAKTKEEIEKCVKKFDSNVVVLLQNAAAGIIPSFEEYVNERAKSEKNEQEIKKGLEELQKLNESLQLKYEDRKKYYFDGCEKANKEELLQALEELINDEKYVEKDSKIYNKMAVTCAYIRVTKDIDKIRNQYTKTIKEFLKELDEKEKTNKFIYLPDNNNSELDNEPIEETNPKTDDDVPGSGMKK